MNRPDLNRWPSPAPATWKQRYEALRQLAAAGSLVLGVDPLGLVLLLRQGVAGWMRSWSGLIETATETPAVPASPPPVIPTSPWQQQVTELLAQMSLAHLPNDSIL
jgi:hypothetical protein